MRTLMIALLAVGSSSASAWDDCEFQAERSLALDATAAQTLTLRTAAGDLRVRGEPGRTRIEVVGKACASSQELLDGIALVERRGARGPEIDTAMPDIDGWSFGSRYAWLDLEVRVPAGMGLALTDSSGDAEISATGVTEARDSSGDLNLEAITGDITLRDSSGDIEVLDARAAVRIASDSSGDIDVRRAQGLVVIESDSSGDIELADVRGDARIERDTSGDITFERITGSVQVRRDTSGSIRADAIGGDFIVESDSSGSIVHNEVAGRIDLPPD
jgi:DUF4097 and DUF4098 domain-containing protein YvlB